MPAKNFKRKTDAKRFAKKVKGKVMKNPFAEIDSRIGKLTVLY